MAKHNNFGDWATGIADAIRYKRGKGETINGQDFEDEIYAIEPLLDTINITSNGKVDVKNYRNASVLVETEDYLKLKNFITNSPERFEVPYGFTEIGKYGLYSETKYLTFEGPELITTIREDGCGRLGTKYPYPQYSAVNEELILPNCVNLGERAFNNRLYKKIELANIIEIPNYAFDNGSYSNNYKINCEINLPKCKKIGQQAFAGICSDGSDGYSIKINIPECTELGNSAFAYNSISEFYAPKITSIPAGCFNAQAVSNGGFKGEFTIPENIISIGQSAFAYNKITKIIFNSKCESIGEQAFSIGNTLEEIQLNEGLKTIGNNAFWGQKLTYVKIPSTVTNIGNIAIKTQKNDNKLIIEFTSNTPPVFANKTPFSLSDLEKIYVPLGAGATYKNTTNLASYADIIVEPNNVILNIPSTLINNETITYSLDGGKTYQQFTNTTLALERVATIKLKSTSADTTILVGTTSGGSDIGTISNSELTYATIGDVSIYLTIQ